MARIFVSPDFLYRRETAPAGADPRAGFGLGIGQPLELFPLVVAARCRAACGAPRRGRCTIRRCSPKQSRRLMADARVRRLATEFACQWLHVYDFDSLSEKSEKVFPEFTELRGDMYEESIRFFTDFFQRDGSVIGLLEADHIFVNDRLAKFYGIPTAPM